MRDWLKFHLPMCLSRFVPCWTSRPSFINQHQYRTSSPSCRRRIIRQIERTSKRSLVVSRERRPGLADQRSRSCILQATSHGSSPGGSGCVVRVIEDARPSAIDGIICALDLDGQPEREVPELGCDDGSGSLMAFLVRSMGRQQRESIPALLDLDDEGSGCPSLDLPRARMAQRRPRIVARFSVALLDGDVMVTLGRGDSRSDETLVQPRVRRAVPFLLLHFRPGHAARIVQPMRAIRLK